MKKLILILLIITIYVPSSFAEVNIVATLPWIGSITKEIAKDKANITVLVKPGQYPHFAEAKPSMILAAKKADIIMYNGLDLEIGYLQLILNSSRNPKIQPGEKGNFDCSKNIEPIEIPVASIDRSMGDVHPLGNPHYLLSPKNILKVAEGITDTLSDIDGSNAEFYRDNLASFKDRLKERQAKWGNNLKGKKFIAYHKYFEYMADEFGFRIIGYIEAKPGIPPSSGHIASLIDTMNNTKPDGILTLSYFGKKEVDFLSNKTGVKGILLPNEVGSQAGITDWLILMDKIVESLK